MNVFDWLGLIGLMSLIAIGIAIYLLGDHYQDQIDKTKWATPPKPVEEES